MRRAAKNLKYEVLIPDPNIDKDPNLGSVFPQLDRNAELDRPGYRVVRSWFTHAPHSTLVTYHAEMVEK